MVKMQGMYSMRKKKSTPKRKSMTMMTSQIYQTLMPKKKRLPIILLQVSQVGTAAASPLTQIATYISRTSRRIQWINR